MKKFDKEKFKWSVKDYFWWLKIYRRRVLYTFVVVELVLIGATIGVNRLIADNTPWWAQTKKYEQEDASTETEKMKLQRCSEFVYVLMKENVILRSRCSNY